MVMVEKIKLDPWWKECIPRNDLLKSNIHENEFTADLGEFLEDRCAEIYRDPIKFFDYSFITNMMKELFINILITLSKKDKSGPSIIQIDTPYGGGKTHTLISLYHLINSQHLLRDHWKLSEIYKKCGKMEKAKVACFIGTVPDPLGTIHTDTGIRTRTFLGEIFYQLGVYGLIKDLDEKGSSFGTKKIGECLNRVGPCLILMDEFLVYVTKMYAQKNNPEILKIIENLFPSIQELFTAIASSSSAVLVITYPSRPEQIFSESANQYKDQLFAWLETYKEVTNRSHTSKMVAKGDEEVGQILQSRLFKSLPPLKDQEKVGESFFTLYKEYKEQFPHYATAEDYKEKIVKSYPFHPELLRIFHEQWGTLPKFQLTRHLLKILALIIKEEFQKSEDERRDSPIIMPSHINLKSPGIQSILFDVIDEKYESVLSLDIKRAENIDKMFLKDSILSRGEYALGLTVIIFLHSFSGSTAELSPREHVASVGVNISSCLFSALAPNYAAPFVDNFTGLPVFEDVIQITKKLLDSEIGLYYLHCTKDRQYFFNLKKNLTHFAGGEFNRIGDKIEGLYSEIKKIWKCQSINLKPIYFPKKPQDIMDDNEQLSVVLLNPKDFIHSETINLDFLENLAELAAENTEKAITGERRRFFKNRLFFLGADAESWRQAKNAYKWAKAWKITSELAIFNNSSKPEKEQATEQMSEYEKKYKSLIQFIFSHLYLYDEIGNIKKNSRDLKQILLVKDISPCQRIYDFLNGQIDENEYIVWNMLRPELLVNHEKYRSAWSTKQKIISAQELWNNFATFTTLPILENQDVLKKCINLGLKKGLFGVAYKKPEENAFSYVALDSDELYPKKSLGEIYLFRLKTEISVKCKDCKKLFKYNPTTPEYLCDDCKRVTCNRCLATVKSKEIEEIGCIKCKSLVFCPNCNILANSKELRLDGEKCSKCLGKQICPACKSPVLEDSLLPSLNNPEYCKLCKKWSSCKKCKIRKVDKELIEGYCRKCKPPEPKKLKCQKCNMKFLPIHLKEGLCEKCRVSREEFVNEISLEIVISNLNREASIFADIQEAFVSKDLDTNTSGKILLKLSIPEVKSQWSSIEEAENWIKANFQSQSRKIDYKIKTGYKSDKQ